MGNYGKKDSFQDEDKFKEKSREFDPAGQWPGIRPVVPADPVIAGATAPGVSVEAPTGLGNVGTPGHPGTTGFGQGIKDEVEGGVVTGATVPGVLAGQGIRSQLAPHRDHHFDSSLPEAPATEEELVAEAKAHEEAQKPADVIEDEDVDDEDVDDEDVDDEDVDDEDVDDVDDEDVDDEVKDKGPGHRW